ncbi:hypothetical protein PCIT_a3574 [Pseudoalteromonas citrea]|uniref:Uncharacterized protein n=1 Tax=Pseudoalteromonas citrea TaxID=43655 RepID=A0AAD4AH90_9GAMM|nr:hypothetical protein PCIT_a3574 [Pseudoalteromonas citrea]
MPTRHHTLKEVLLRNVTNKKIAPFNLESSTYIYFLFKLSQHELRANQVNENQSDHP